MIDIQTGMIILGLYNGILLPDGMRQVGDKRFYSKRIPIKHGEFREEDGLTSSETKKLADDDSYFNESTLASEALSLSLVSFSDSSF